jgi:putative protease
MPYIFRKSTISKFESMYQQIAEKFDGVVVRNWETYVWLKRKNYSKEMISDYNMYTFNRAAKRFHEKEGFMMCTAPVELNAGELKKLDISGEAMIVYGYQPVMISAGCVQKNTDKCTQKEGILYLTDRYHKKFAVKNYCKCCYNVIYNSSPLLLIGQKEEFEKLKPACLRLDFSIETGEETKTILEMFEDNYLGDLLPDISDIDYTKGHFRRGVK